MIDWQTVAATALTSTTAIAVVGFILKSLFAQLMARDIERYKADLTKSHEIELQGFKAALEKTAFEHQTRFASLHARRAEVIAELYSALADAEEAAVSMVRPLQMAGEAPQEEKRKPAYERAQALQPHINKNRIYFSESLCKLLDEYLKTLHSALIDFDAHLMMDKGELAAWMKSWERLTEAVPPIKAQIESDFRRLLGAEAG